MIIVDRHSADPLRSNPIDIEQEMVISPDPIIKSVRTQRCLECGIECRVIFSSLLFDRGQIKIDYDAFSIDQDERALEIITRTKTEYGQI